jgi:hypothetical protein
MNRFGRPRCSTTAGRGAIACDVPLYSPTEAAPTGEAPIAGELSSPHPVLLSPPSSPRNPLLRLPFLTHFVGINSKALGRLPLDPKACGSCNSRFDSPRFEPEAQAAPSSRLQVVRQRSATSGNLETITARDEREAVRNANASAPELVRTPRPSEASRRRSSGARNSGLRNSVMRSSGLRNSGLRSSGLRNSEALNSGVMNSEVRSSEDKKRRRERFVWPRLRMSAASPWRMWSDEGEEGGDETSPGSRSRDDVGAELTFQRQLSRSVAKPVNRVQRCSLVVAGAVGWWCGSREMDGSCWQLSHLAVRYHP